MAIIRRGDCGDAVANSDAAGSAQFHVLAVDDCVIDRKVIERLLKTSFYKVTAVESASRALEVLGVNEGEPPPLDSYNDLKVNMIITDYCMPGMNGYDLLKKVKETKGLKEIPVVMMSSEDVPHRVKRCLAEGAEDFLMKPVQIEDIKKLRSRIKPPKAVCSTKRKVSSDRVAGKSSERRPRLNGVVVA
uniref:Response regulatory domain-containing protein n=1 Tax=Araucaria cunninghamii TaxID=56994 RepID=A0A0D6R9G6_ARACU